MSYTLVLIISSILMLLGIIASFLPALPGLIYMLVIAILFGWYDHFVHVTGTDIIILAIIAIVAMVIDTVSGMIGAKVGGAHWSALISGFVGLILGSFFIPVPIIGSLIGMFIGILASEWYRTRDIEKAKKAAVGSFLGSLAGTGVKVAFSIVFLGLFIFFALK